MDEYSLPVLSGPVDHLRQGFQGLQLKESRVATHGVEDLQKSDNLLFSQKLDMVRRTYGSHMAMRLATEQMIHNRDRRLPGLQSSSVTCDTLAGLDNSIGFADFLNDPMTRPSIPKLTVHGELSIVFGLD